MVRFAVAIEQMQGAITEYVREFGEDRDNVAVGGLPPDRYVQTRGGHPCFDRRAGDREAVLQAGTYPGVEARTAVVQAEDDSVKNKFD